MSAHPSVLGMFRHRYGQRNHFQQELSLLLVLLVEQRLRKWTLPLDASAAVRHSDPRMVAVTIVPLLIFSSSLQTFTADPVAPPSNSRWTCGIQCAEMRR